MGSAQNGKETEERQVPAEDLPRVFGILAVDCGWMPEPLAMIPSAVS